MELDIEVEEWKCPHCGAPGSEVTYIEASNKDYVRAPKGGYEWKLYPKARSLMIYILFECGGETGYGLDTGIGCHQYDDQAENRCPQHGV